MTDSDDMLIVQQCADKLGVGFMLAGMSMEQVVTCMLGFMGGRVPSSPQEMKLRVLNSYAALICHNTEDALSHEEEQRLYEILKRHAQRKKLHQKAKYTMVPQVIYAYPAPTVPPPPPEPNPPPEHVGCCCHLLRCVRACIRFFCC